MQKLSINLSLSLALMVGVAVPVSATEISQPTLAPASVYLDATSKTTFAAEMEAKHDANLKNGKIKRGTIAEIDNLMMQSTFATGSEKEKINQQLETLGVYEYAPSSSTSNAIVPFSTSGDVTLTTPTVFYESWENTWTVTCGGNWRNSNWNEQLFLGNVGGSDAFGVGFTNTTKPYKSYVIRSSAYITNQSNTKSSSTTNRSDGDGSKGFGFRLQDSIISINAGSSYDYIGYRWYGSSTYDFWFGNYSGVATGYYIHTWSSAQITGIKFGVDGKSAGIEVTISSGDKSFTAYSNDKTFGVYP